MLRQQLHLHRRSSPQPTGPQYSGLNNYQHHLNCISIIWSSSYSGPMFLTIYTEHGTIVLEIVKAPIVCFLVSCPHIPNIHARLLFRRLLVCPHANRNCGSTPPGVREGLRKQPEGLGMARLYMPGVEDFQTGLEDPAPIDYPVSHLNYHQRQTT